MKVLIVVAHPDDETLGCGGTIARHISKGDDVRLFVMTDNFRSPNIFSYFKKAIEILGVNNYELIGLPDSELERFTTVELTQKIETLIGDNIPDIVYTHYYDGLSQDHRITAQVVQIVFRPIWSKKVSLYAFEIPSDTDWSAKPFIANMFVDINDYLKYKLEAMSCYETETRDFPHSRSEESLIARAKFWGTHCGLKAAEAFRVLREVK